MPSIQRPLGAFPSGINVERFHSEMAATSFPSTPTTYVSTTSNLTSGFVDIEFTVLPDATDEATTDGVIATHSGTSLGLLTENEIVLGTQGGDLDGTLPNCDVVAITDSGSTSHPITTLTEGEYLTVSGGNITTAAVVGGTDELVKISASDTTPATLANKMVNAGAISLIIQNLGGDEDLEVGMVYGTPVDIGSANNPGTTDNQTVRVDHVHAHGSQGGGSQHSLVTTSVAGFMSAADKVKLDGFGAATALVVFDHFMSSNEDTDEIGLHGWRRNTTGAGSDVDISSESGHPGIVVLQAGTANTGRVALHLGGDTQPGTMFIGGTNDIFFECLIKFAGSILSADLEMVQAGLGLEVGDAGEFLNGVYVRFNPSVSSALTLVAANGGVRTEATGTTSMALGTWYRVGFTVTDPSGSPSIQMQVNGTNEGSAVTTNIPTGALAPTMKIDSNGGATGPEALFDYYHIQQVTDLED